MKQSSICTSSHMSDVRTEKMVEVSYCVGAVIVRTVNKGKVYQALTMWQSWVEIEHYSVAYFDCITAFEVV